MLPFPPCLAVLAESPIPGTGGITADQAQLIGWGIAGVIFVATLQLLGFCLTAYKTFQKSPPLHETYATKDEVRQAVTGMRDQFTALSARIEKVDGGIDEKLEEIFEALRGINRSLGRVEGIEKSTELLEQGNSRRFNEISTRLQSIEEKLRS
jgi:tetrahydromethanopterin S-methyltransferase subunit G